VYKLSLLNLQESQSIRERVTALYVANPGVGQGILEAGKEVGEGWPCLNKTDSTAWTR
jgi:hypothetical protein